MYIVTNLHLLKNISKWQTDYPLRLRKEEVFMNAIHRRRAFTLIEVLIVVIIMALLAATIIPQFSSSTSDAKKSSLDFNAHTMRSIIQMYRAQHNAYPTLTTNIDQLTKPTNIDGETSGANLIYGPYLLGPMPVNPYTNTNDVTTVSSAGNMPTGPGAQANKGWQYDQSNGGFYPNNAEFFQ